jgi:peptide/nickel transport system ATP-binding protein
MGAPNPPLLEVEGLNVTFTGGGAPMRAVRDVSFTLRRERLGIVGESGSGKSTTGRALLGLLPPSAKVEAARMSFQGTDLTRLSQSGWRELRGRHMSMVMQDPKFSLNPVVKVGEQIMETLRLHKAVSSAEARRQALAMLEAVRIRDPERVFELHPHQLSGGMGQRVMIAAMLIAEPDLLIADEPTSALDVTVQNQVLRILDDLVAARGMGLIFISHNLTAIASFCDRVLVMYGGRIMEELPARELGRASHPYTRALLAAAPDLDRPREELAVVVRDPAWIR